MAGIPLRVPTITRYPGDSIRVGDIVVQFVGQKGGKAGIIKILAPEGVPIYRSEIDPRNTLTPKA